MKHSKVNTCRVKSSFIVELDNPPVNAISLTVREGLQQAIDRLSLQEGISRVILTGKGDVFAAGGDLKEFDSPPIEPHLPDLIEQIESSELPWIAAVNGTALGGGCELTLGCKYRIAVPDCQIGFPEVTLGVVPGSGGTQRLPRLAGIETAMELISTGRPVSATKALEVGLIDMISDDPLSTAIELSNSILSQAKNIAELPAPKAIHDVPKIPRSESIKFSNLMAPQKARELILASAETPLADGLKLERETFLELRASEQARSLRHIFFAERKAKSVRFGKTTAIEHVAVVGGGTMGSGIAYALLNSGYRTTVIETDSQTVDWAKSNVNKVIEASVKRNFISEADAIDHHTQLMVGNDYTSISDASLVIEAVPEDMQIKKSVFETLEAHVADSAILASNTSYLDINEIASGLKEPSRVVGLHFFAPAHIMKLVEIIRGAASSQSALAAAFALARKLRKVPVLAGVCDGFIGNRILSRYREAADTLLMDGALPWDIDRAMVGFGYPMGPYEAQDLSGLDIAYANRRRQDATRDPSRRYIPIADRMVDNNRIGRKSGCGWYQYSASGEKQIDPQTEELIIAESKRAGISRVEYPQNEIRERLLSAMINEAADILQEGIAQSASDIDLVTVFGYGFPRWRGGLMHYADSIGIKQVLSKLEELQKEDPAVWKPSPVLHQCATKDLKLSDYQR